MNVVALLGSLRADSFNRKALDAAIELAPEGMSIEVLDIGSLPLYNQDIEDAGAPDNVRVLKEKIRAADAVLFVSPEYNYSMPGVLKNAIDWASRPAAENAFNDKPCAIMSASTGMLGGARMQYHLRQTCVFLNLHPLNKPEVIIAKVADKFDAHGRLTDEMARKLIRDLLFALQNWTNRLKRS